MLIVFKGANRAILLRNILLGLRQLFEKLQRVLDGDIDDIVNILLDKAFKEDLTQRTFMELKHCLGVFIHHLSENKIIVALAKFLGGNNTQGILVVLLCIEKIIGETSIAFIYNKGAGVLMNIMVKNMSNPTYEIKTVARRVFLKLIGCGFERPELERFLRESISGEDFLKISEFMVRTGKKKI